MVLLGHSSDGTQVRILARGNFSLDASGLVALLAALGLVTLLMAGLLASQGYWPILLVALVQLLLVAWILIQAWERAWVMEVVEIGGDRISVTHQRYRDKHQYDLNPAWARIRMEKSDIAWYAPRLILRSKQKEIELGAFLTSEEKHRMAAYLRDAIAEHNAWRTH
jgi:uncharacterized membrane protein